MKIALRWWWWGNRRTTGGTALKGRGIWKVENTDVVLSGLKFRAPPPSASRALALKLRPAMLSTLFNCTKVRFKARIFA